MKKKIARFLLPLFLIYSIMTPRTSDAILPIAIPIIAAIVDGTGAVIASDIFGSAATALIGGAALALILSTPGDSSQVRIPLTSSTPTAAIAAPSAPSTLSSTSVPTYSYLICLYNHVNCVSGTTWDIAWANFKSGVIGSSGYLCSSHPDTVGTDQMFWYGTTGNPCTTNVNGVGPVQAYVSISQTGTTNGCSAGYTSSGNACNLSNARAAAPDSKQDFSRSGTTLSPYTGDDHGSLYANNATTTNSNDTVATSGLNSSGEPNRVSLQATSNGGSIITSDTQKTDANGNTYVQRTTVTVRADGVVSGVTVNTSSQALIYNPATHEYDLVTAPASTANPSPAANSIEFPDDYARVGEAAAAANILAPKLDDIKDTLIQTSTVDDPTLPTVDDMPAFGDTFNDLLGWSLPSHVSVCPKPSVDLSNILGDGHVYMLSSHCGLMETYGPVLRSAMMVVFTIAALFTVLGA